MVSYSDLALDQPPPNDVAMVLTQSTAQGTRRPVAFRHTLVSVLYQYYSEYLTSIASGCVKSLPPSPHANI